MNFLVALSVHISAISPSYPRSSSSRYSQKILSSFSSFVLVSHNGHVGSGASADGGSGEQHECGLARLLAIQVLGEARQVGRAQVFARVRRPASKLGHLHAEHARHGRVPALVLRDPLLLLGHSMIRPSGLHRMPMIEISPSSR